MSTPDVEGVVRETKVVSEPYKGLTMVAIGPWSNCVAFSSGDERLQERTADIVTIAGSGNRPDVIEQRPMGPLLLLLEDY